MSNTFFMRFGAGDPRVYTGLAPTFLVFKLLDGTNVTSPAIGEVTAGTGIYGFTFGVTLPLTFIADAATTSPGTDGRYVTGAIDPADRIDYFGTTIMAIGTTGVAIGTTGVALGTTSAALGVTAVSYGLLNLAQGSTIFALGTTGVAIGTTVLSYLSSGSLGGLNPFIGTTVSSYGNSTLDPTDIMGYVKRLQEILEGNASFGRTQQTWDLYSRGSTTLLRSKSIGTDAVGVTKV